MFGQYALPHGAGRGYLEEGRRCYTDLYNALIGTSDRMETLLSEGKRTREGRERSECVGLLCEECVCSIYCVVYVVLCSAVQWCVTYYYTMYTHVRIPLPSFSPPQRLRVRERVPSVGHHTA